MKFQLNPQQQAAVSCCDQPLLVLAGAGSGKTGVITQKVVHLVRQQAMLPEKIAAITFTRKAAREMRQRIAGILGDEAKGVWISTFHALGLRILREECGRLGYRPGFSIFDPQDTQGMLREILPDGSSKDDIERVRWQISAWKNDGLSPETAPGEPTTIEYFALYQQRLAHYNAFDFDDLVSRPGALLESDSECRERWQWQFRHVLVDECQDTNACQYRLLKALTGPRTGLTAVGDDDQSIYGWRGARPDNLDQLGQDFKGLAVIKLEQNYRSSGTILKAANALIANNPHTLDKALWSDLGEGDLIALRPCSDPADEADQVVAAILQRKFTLKAQPGDFAILYRSNHQARALEQALRGHRLPYRVSGGPSWFERSEIKDLICYLRLLANPSDDAAFLRIVNRPRREIGAGSVDKIATVAARRNCALLAAAANLPMTINARSSARIEQFVSWMNELRHAELPPAQLIAQIVEHTGYRDFVARDAADDAAGRTRVKSVDDFVQWLSALEGDLQEVIQQLSLGDDEGNEEQDDRVRLMTLHAAKGLEFPHVFLVGVEEGVLPHKNSLDDGQLEEERRLMYVGITRARQTLTISWCEARRRFGEIEDGGVSRFVAEIPKALVHHHGDTQAQTPGTAKAHLAGLRDMLKDLDT
ncbi:MAG: ATP-dependent helicase [Lysobacterales bacterium]